MNERNVSETVLRILSKLYRLYESVVYGEASETEEIARDLARTFANVVDTMLQSLEKACESVSDRNVRNLIEMLNDVFVLAKITALYLAGSRKYLGSGAEKVASNFAACVKAFLDELGKIYSDMMSDEFEEHSTNVVKTGLALFRILEAVTKSELTKFVRTIGKTSA